MSKICLFVILLSFQGAFGNSIRPESDARSLLAEAKICTINAGPTVADIICDNGSLRIAVPGGDRTKTWHFGMAYARQLVPKELKLNSCMAWEGMQCHFFRDPQ